MHVVVDDQRRVIGEALLQVDLLAPCQRGNAWCGQVVVSSKKTCKFCWVVEMAQRLWASVLADNHFDRNHVFTQLLWSVRRCSQGDEFEP